MKVQQMALSELKPLERNPRLHPERQLQEMARSLEMFGQYRPIVVDSTHTILAGNGLFLTMERLGWKKASVLVLHDLDEKTRNKLILTDNKLAELGGTDFSVVDDILRDLDEDFDIPGFDPMVLADLMSVPDVVHETAMEYGQIPADTYQSMQAASDRIQEGHAGVTIGTPPPPIPAPQPTSLPAAPLPDSAGPVEDEEGGSVCPTCRRPW